MKTLIGTVVLLVAFFQIGAAFADTSSTNYALTEDRFTGGSGSASSANYQIAESSFDSFANAAMSSTNYAVEEKVGISGGKGIATINSISPSNLSKIYSDGNASFVMGAVSQDGDILQYEAKQDSTVKAGPQASSTLTWALSTSDQGRHTMTFQAIDPDGTALTKQDAYVVRRPTK